jgi:hypothetical protein
MKIPPGFGRALILGAWALYLAALFLPAVDIDLVRVPHLLVARLRGWEAALFSLAIVRGFLDEPTARGLWYLLIPLGNIALFVCPLELKVRHHLRRLAVPVTVLSALALACVVLLPTFEGPTFAARHAGHFLMLAALATLAAGNIALVNEAIEPSPAPGRRARGTAPPP